MSALSDAAFAYAEQGLPVFPLQPKGKTPLTAHGLDDATVDQMTIETWWTRWPNANIAIRTGDVVVVDEDRLGAFEELAAEAHETIPVNAGIVKTSSGRHFWFLQPEGERIRNTAGRLAPGIDTRGDGGYVVAPPSIHPSGAVYEWLAAFNGAYMPGWVVELLRRKQPERQPMPDIPLFGTTPYGQRALEMEIFAVANAVEGTRNDALNRAAFALGQLVSGGEVDQSDATRSLEAASRAAGLNEIESVRTIRSGFQSGLAEPRSAPDNGTVRKTPSGTALRAVSDDPIVETEPERDSWIPVNLNDLPDTPPVKPDLGGTNLVYPGKRHVFSGPPESAKTLAAYCILIQIARCGGMGILIDFEMGGYDARKRLYELGATREEIDRILYIEPDEPATSTRINRLVELGPELVVIDASAGVYSLEGLDDNKRLDVEKVSNLYIRTFWRNGIASILIDHVVKDGESRGRFVIGSERKLGGADVHLGFDTIKEISRGSAGKYKLTTHKDRGGFLKRGYLADLNLDSDPDTHAISWSFTEAKVTTESDGTFRRTQYMERVSLKLEMADDTITVNEVKKLVGGTRQYVADAIETLIHEGHIVVTEGPNRSKNLTSTKPYREADDPALNTEKQAGGSVGRRWFGSGSESGQSSSESGGSPLPFRAGAPGSPDAGETDPVSPGWFDTDGNFNDPDPEWLSSVDPGPDEHDD